MKSKRILSILLCTAITASVISGCANTPKDTNASSTTGTGSVTTDKKAYFPLEKQITIKVAGVRADSSAPFSDVTMFKELEKETNVKIEWIDWPGSVLKEKRNLAFAGGDLPDAFYGSWVLDKPDVVKYGGEGFLLDLNKYLNKEYMPNFSRIIEKEDGLLKSLAVPEGQVYVLPTLNKNGLPKTNDTMVINTQWLEKVGKKMPTTTNELVDVLTAFKKAGDLNGNGKNDEIPMSYLYNDGNSGFFNLMGFTGIPAQNKNSRMVIKDNAPAFFPALDEYKEYLTFINKLYVAGLLDKEVFTMDVSSYNAKTQTPTPTVGFLSTWTADSVNKSIEGNDITKEGVYQYMPPIKGASGVEPKVGLRINPLNGNLSFAANAKTKYAEEIVRWIDLAYSKENSINNYVGVVGKHIKSEGGDNYSSILNSNGKNFSQDEMSLDIPKKYAVAYVLEGEATFIDKKLSPQDKISADKVYAPYMEMNYVNDFIMSTVEEGNRMALLATDLLGYSDQMTAKFVTEGKIDAGWDAYIKQLKALGLDEYVKIKTDIHNRANSK